VKQSPDQGPGFPVARASDALSLNNYSFILQYKLKAASSLERFCLIERENFPVIFPVLSSKAAPGDARLPRDV
jgi:hypothetical protein